MSGMSSTAPRRGRPTKNEAHLSRSTIVTAALALIDSEGVGAVSMRTVGRRLGVDAKSLYHHVAGKEQLLDAVAESILASIEVPVPTGDLRTDLRAAAHAFRVQALSHPQAATLVLTRQLKSVRSLAPVEGVLHILLTAGFDSDEAVNMLRTMLAALIGTLLREVNAGPTYGTTDTAGIAARAADLTEAGLPSIRAVAPQLARFDAEAEFDYMIDAVVDLIVARRA